MAKQRTSHSTNSITESPLVTEISRLADELHLVREILDDIRTDIQWAVQNGRIQIVQGESETKNLLPPVTLFEPGDAVEFEHEGEEQFGEVVSPHDAENTAIIMLIPSQEQVTVSQDILRKVTPDPLQLTDETIDSPRETESEPPALSEEESQKPTKPKDSLF